MVAIIVLVGMAVSFAFKPGLIRRQGSSQSHRRPVFIAAEVERFAGRRLKLRAPVKLDLPDGAVYEVRSTDSKFYFHVDPRRRAVVYASLGEIEFRQPTESRLDTDQAQAVALGFARQHRRDFKDYRFSPGQAGFQWPKPTYHTFIWDRRRSPDFAKVTVDAVTGKVVSFGRGNSAWSAFCLPKK